MYTNTLNDKFTIILPSRGLDGKYLKLVLQSYEKYFSDVYEVIIISPDANLQDYVNRNNNKKLTYRIIHDNIFELNKKGELKPNHPWYNQQFIKLLVSQYVETELYMVLDDDIFLIKPFGYNDIFDKNNIRRIKYNTEPYSTLSTPNYSSRDWWHGSCQLLNVDTSNIINNDYLMNVTPQVFITNKVLTLLLHLYSNCSKDNWMDKFIELKCSEYSLYWLWLIKTQSTGLYTHLGNKFWYTDTNCNILEPINSFSQFLQTINNGFDVHINNGYFMVIQSYLNYPENIIGDIVGKFIK